MKKRQAIRKESQTWMWRGADVFFMRDLRSWILQPTLFYLVMWDAGQRRKVIKKSSNQFSFYPPGCFTLCYQHVNESFLYLPARVYMYLRTSLPQVSIYSLKSVTPGRRSLLCAWVTLSVCCVGVLYLFFSLTQVGHQRICCRLECVAWCHPILPSPH